MLAKLKVEVKRSPIGAEEKSSFVAQLLSGFRDPREVTAARSPNYTADDYAQIASSIYSLYSPADLFHEFVSAYGQLNSVEEKAIFLHNARHFIFALIHYDLKYQRLDKTLLGLQVFMESILQAEPSEKVKSNIVSIQEYLQKEGLLAKEYRRKALLQVNAEMNDGNLDIDEMTQQSDKSDSAAKVLAEDYFKMQKMLFSKVNFDEIYNKSWIDNKGSSLNHLAKFFNRISNSVSSDILFATSRQHQINIMSFYLKTIDFAINHGDYQTALAIYSGFNPSAIFRLHLLDELNHEDKLRFEKYDKLFAREKNYANLRTDFATRKETNQDVIFPMNIYLGDVNFLYEGNPKKNQVSKKENDLLLIGLGKKYNELSQTQTLSFTLTPKILLQTNLQKKLATAISDPEEMHELSLLIMPSKEAKPNFKYVKSYHLIYSQIAKMMKDHAYLAKDQEDQLQLAMAALEKEGLKIDESVFSKIQPQLLSAISRLKKENQKQPAASPRRPPRPMPRDKTPFYQPESSLEKHLPAILREPPSALEWKIAREYFRRNPSAVKLSRRSTESRVSHSFIKIDGKIYVLRIANETGKTQILHANKKQKILLAEDQDRNRFGVNVEAYTREKINESEINILKELNFFYGRAIRHGAKERSYTLMPYIAGHELYSGFLRPAAFVQLTEKDKLEIGLKIVKLIKWLHARGIVHGDLKAQNLLVKRNAKGGWDVVLIDWTTAIKLEESQHEAPGRAHPSKGFSAPELEQNRLFSSATDVYALGVVLKMQLGLQSPEVDAMLAMDARERVSLSLVEDALKTQLENTSANQIFDIKFKIKQYATLNENEKIRVLNHLASIPLLNKETRELYPLTLDNIMLMHQDLQKALKTKQPWILEFYQHLDNALIDMAIENALLQANSLAQIPTLLKKYGLEQYQDKVNALIDQVTDYADRLKSEKLIAIAAINEMEQYIDTLNFADSVTKATSEHLKDLLKKKYATEFDWQNTQDLEIKPKSRWAGFISKMKSTWEQGGLVSKALSPVIALPSLFEEPKEEVSPYIKRNLGKELLSTERALIKEMTRVSDAEQMIKAHPEVSKIYTEKLASTTQSTSRARAKAPALQTIKRSNFLKINRRETGNFSKNLIDLFNQGSAEEKLARKKRFSLNLINKDSLVFASAERPEPNTVYIQQKEHNIIFSLSIKTKENTPEYERLLMQTINLLVATAQFGDDFVIEEENPEKNQKMKEVLEKAIARMGRENLELARSLTINGVGIKIRPLPATPPRPLKKK